MEFWKCLNEGKSLFLPQVLELPVDEAMNSRNKVSSETLYDDTSNYPLMSNQESIQFGFRQANCNDPRRNGLSDQIGLDCYTETASPDKQLRSRMPSLFVGSDSLDLATVDLKLGGLADSICSRDGQSSKNASSVHSNSSVPIKRSRLTSSYSHAPVCQVLGCNKDLSSFKDYYKRHKVCDAHTKTAKVFVKGIEQRFCQQCSRFHLLAEFDDGKRSCRKRLANHNERRRKSPGTRFLRSSSMRTSFLFQEMLPTEISCPSKHESGKWFSDMKFEDPILDSNSLLNFHDNISVGTIDESSRITVPNVQDSSRALSLLSSQSLKDSNSLFGTHLSNPYKSAQEGFTYSEKIGPSGDVEDDLKVPDDSLLFVSDSSNNKYCHSSGQGSVMDLMQLSSHLQMVERKRNLMH